VLRTNARVDIVVAGHSVKWEMSANIISWCIFRKLYKILVLVFKKKNKAGFLKSFNRIFGKIGRGASEEMLFELIKSKCLPILLYGTDVCPMNSADRHSLQFYNKQDSV